MRFEAFTRQAEIVKQRFKKIAVQIEQAEQVTQLSASLTRRLIGYDNEVKNKFENFEINLNDLVSTDPLPENYDEALVVKYQDIISELYLDIHSAIQTILPEPPTTRSEGEVVPPPAKSSVRLPKINLPVFSGDINEWMSFHSLFSSTIHKNVSLTHVEKMQYLLCSLKNEALDIVKSLPISSGNYRVAWEILNKRYHSKRRLLTLHINKLLDLNFVANNSASNLRQFITNYSENTQALSALNLNVEKESAILFSILFRKLNSELRQEFEKTREDSHELPNVKELIEFIESKCRHLEDADIHPAQSSQVTNKPETKGNFAKPKLNTNHNYHKSPPGANRFTLMTSTNKHTCLYCCKHDHNIYSCLAFKKLSVEDRFKYIKTTNYCINCFGTAHTPITCRSKNTCHVCHKKHHTLLHRNISHQAVSCRNTEQQPTHTNTTTLLASYSNKYTLLATTLIKVGDSTGNSHVIRAVIDTGSQNSLLTERAIQMINCKRSYISTNIKGLSNIPVKSKGLVNLNISTLNGKVIIDNHPIIIVDKITSDLPSVDLPQSIKQRLNHYVLADPTFDIKSRVDAILGAEVCAHLFTGDKHNLGPDMPIAYSTVCGWVLLGATSITENSNKTTSTFSLLTSQDMELHSELQKFWTVEEPPRHKLISLDEEVSENHFVETHSRDKSGRYIVRLPLKGNVSELGLSNKQALKRFHSLEYKFKKDAGYKKQYAEFMLDYLYSGHMIECGDPTLQYNPAPHYFLPHHGVIKESSSTTRLRVVFDASQNTDNNISLNDMLMTGPKLHSNIVDLILLFRRHKYVMSCDVKQMYRQIKVHDDDQNLQLIYWREKCEQPLKVYKLTTVTYGMKSSPFIAQRTLRQLVEDEGENFAEAAKVLKTEIFMDDIITGSDTIEHALTLRDELKLLLQKGGFQLRKWVSNTPRLLENIPHEELEEPLKFNQSDQPLFTVLGLYWNTKTDHFCYKFNLPELHSTKRSILSIIARLYDPCGWISPIIFWAKAFIQILWTLNLGWDDCISHEMTSRWNKFIKEVQLLETLEIPRSLNLTKNARLDLHGFADASEVGYAGVVYLRIETTSNTSTRIILAKSKIAPLKKVSLPRLELCAAHLLANLLHHVFGILNDSNYSIASMNAWSDSTIVLSWLQTPPYQLKTYVANRVAEIQERIPSSCWSHIKSEMNPADCASRGLYPSQLLDKGTWFTGPKWLTNPRETWPVSNFTPLVQTQIPEYKTKPFVNLLSLDEPKPNQIQRLFHRFSSWPKLLRIVAYILRFIKNARSSRRISGGLDVDELDSATHSICKNIQYTHFAYDIDLIRNAKRCQIKLQRLAPFIDEFGLLRAGGRLKNSDLSYEGKHPIILPKDDHVVTILIDHYHVKYLHAGPRLLQSILAENYWILSARTLIRSRIFKCVQCFRAKPRNSSPLMGDLPKARVNAVRPFLKCGMDLAGPFQVKIHNVSRFKTVKVYICLFICFVTKAVHIELVTDLTAQAFIAALTRFTSRRGLCTDLYSDCGTNFRGASLHLAKIYKDFLRSNETQLQDFATSLPIKFHFNPPSAPHQGGLWESSIKNIKYHLVRVIGEQVITLEELNTLVITIEAMLNSRPLTPLSSDPSDYEALTPGHFLIGSALTSIPEKNIEECNLRHLTRWQRVQAMSQHIWSRWHKEYLHTLMQRTKWHKSQKPLKIGDLVLVQDAQTPPLSWPLARITATYPGTDGQVRVVRVRTSKREFSRPAVKVFPLPIN